MQKKDKKPKLVFIYGFVAVGKLTVARELVKLTKYKILHNHMMIDLIGDIFGHERPGTVEKAEARQWIHFGLTQRLMSTGKSYIFTHAYWESYVYENGMTDSEFVKKIEKIVKDAGGIFCPVFLSCSKEEMLKRVKDESRKSHKKLRSVKIMKELLKRKDYGIPALIKNNFIVDTTKNSPRKTAEMIKKHFDLD